MSFLEIANRDFRKNIYNKIVFMKLNLIIKVIFTKKYFVQTSLLSVYCIGDREMKNILQKKENPVLTLDFDLKDKTLY